MPLEEPYWIGTLMAWVLIQRAGWPVSCPAVSRLPAGPEQVRLDHHEPCPLQHLTWAAALSIWHFAHIEQKWDLAASETTATE